MQIRCRWLSAALLVVPLGLATAVQAANPDNLKLVVGELPLPTIMFHMGFSLALDDTALVGLGDPAAALRKADEQLAADARNAEAHLTRGMALQVLGRPGAEDEYAAAAAIQEPALTQGEDPEGRLDWARAKVLLKDYAAARPVLEALAASHPDLWWPHFGLAMDTMRSWDPTTAAKDQEGLRTALGQLADTALAHVHDALRVAPDQPAARLLASLIRWTRVTGALTAAGGTVSTQGLADLGEEDLRAVARDCPDEPRVQVFVRWATLARALSEAGSPEGWATLWGKFRPEDQRTLTQDELATAAMVRTEAGRVPSAYELLAMYAAAHGDDRGAEARLRESVDYDPTSLERWEAAIGNAAREGDLDRMATLVTEALTHADTGKLRCTASKLHAKRGDLAAAEQEALAAVGLKDESLALAQLMLGVIRLKAGNAAGAIEPLQTAVVRWTDDGLAETSLGLALALTGRTEEAVPHLTRAREMSPDEPLVESALNAVRG